MGLRLRGTTCKTSGWTRLDVFVFLFHACDSRLGGSHPTGIVSADVVPGLVSSDLHRASHLIPTVIQWVSHSCRLSLFRSQSRKRLNNVTIVYLASQQQGWDLKPGSGVCTLNNSSVSQLTWKGVWLKIQRSIQMALLKFLGAGPTGIQKTKEHSKAKGCRCAKHFHLNLSQ